MREMQFDNGHWLAVCGKTAEEARKNLERGYRMGATSEPPETLKAIWRDGFCIWKREA